MKYNKKVRILLSLLVFSIVSSLFGTFQLNINTLAAEKKPSLASTASVKQYLDKSLSIKKNGFTIKSVSAKTDKPNVATVKSSGKTGIIITGVSAGTANITTTIKAKTKKSKVKTIRIKTKVTVTNPDPIYVKPIDATHLSIYFAEPQLYLQPLQVWIRCLSNNSNFFVADDGLTNDGKGLIYNATLKTPGLINDEDYEVTITNTELKANFSFRRKVSALAFKDGKKKTLKNIKFVAGKKIGTFKLKNTYGLTPEYSLSGLNGEMFEIDQSGNLSFKAGEKNKTKLKKMIVVVTAKTPLTDVYAMGEASITLTIKLK